MPVLFHQNMRNFGGGAVHRTNAYATAFGAIGGAFAGGGALGAIGPIAVAGFTEIVNNGASANALAGLCGNNLGVTFQFNIACGQTVLANGPEYIGIGVHGGLNIISVGRIFLKTVTSQWGGSIGLIHDVAPAPLTAAWCDHIHPSATYDYRGLVYVVVSTGGGNPVRFAVGFLHNNYTDGAARVAVAGKLPDMAKMMGEGVGGIAAKYIGGDFNVPVQPTRGTTRLGHVYAYAAGLPGTPVFFAPPNPPPPPTANLFQPGGTLWSGNLYDYWFSTLSPLGPGPNGLLLPPLPMVLDNTLDTIQGVVANSMSDHCASALQII